MKYTSELKKEAVRLVMEENHTVIAVANMLLISDSSITFWVRFMANCLSCMRAGCHSKKPTTSQE